jgi:hypothetical protein
VRGRRVCRDSRTVTYINTPNYFSKHVVMQTQFSTEILIW